MESYVQDKIQVAVQTHILHVHIFRFLSKSDLAEEATHITHIKYMSTNYP